MGATHLPDHRAAVIDELGQHHGHVVVNSGGVVRPLCRVAHKRAEGKDGCAAHLWVGQGAVTLWPAVWLWPGPLEPTRCSVVLSMVLSA